MATTVIVQLDLRRTAVARHVARVCRKFIASTQAIAAVEFALALPIMLTLYFGMVEVTSAINASRKVGQVSRSLGDVTGRLKSASDTAIADNFNAVAQVIQPYDASNLRMTVSSIVVKMNDETEKLEGRVCWSETRNGQALARGTVVPVPGGYNTRNTSFVLASSEYEYTPTIGYTISGTLNLKRTVRWPVRNAGEVARTGTNPATCLNGEDWDDDDD